MGRLYCVPDIHGRLDLLNQLLDTLTTVHSLDLTQDKLIFLGDMIDRGPDSCGVICRIKALQEDHPDNVVALAGNHDLMPVMYYGRNKQQHDADLWFFNGGIQTLEYYKYLGLSEMSYDHLVCLSKLPLKHTEPGFFFSHAPAPRESYRNIMSKGLDFTPDELTWTYHPDEFGIARDHGDGIVGVCGHIHQLKKGIMAPRFYDHYIFGDSGAGCSPKAPLCAIEVKTREVIYAWP